MRGSGFEIQRGPDYSLNSVQEEVRTMKKRMSLLLLLLLLTQSERDSFKPHLVSNMMWYSTGLLILYNQSSSSLNLFFLSLSSSQGNGRDRGSALSCYAPDSVISSEWMTRRHALGWIDNQCPSTKCRTIPPCLAWQNRASHFLARAWIYRNGDRYIVPLIYL